MKRRREPAPLCSYGKHPASHPQRRPPTTMAVSLRVGSVS